MNIAFKIGKYLIFGLVGLITITIIVVMGASYLWPMPDMEITPAGNTRNISKYVSMPDGVKIAADIWFPANFEANKRYPTAITMTRYWRADHRLVFQRGLFALGILDREHFISRKVKSLNAAGYIVVQVDARGTGASFGYRKTEHGPKEIADYGKVLEWIGKQSWSNGKVGSYGVSYSGNTAELVITTDRPELKVSAPFYNDFNPFLGLLQPGGAQNTYLNEWGALTYQLDRNDLCGLEDISGITCWFIKTFYTNGVKPVRGQESLLEAALEEHKKNIVIVGSDSETEYLDDPYRGGYTAKDISPFGYQREIEKAGVPIVMHLGWMDAATVEGALHRYSTFSNDQHLLIGPFSHGGGRDTDPFMDTARHVSPSREEQFDALIRYFDLFLKGNESNLTPRKKVTYYTLGADKWYTTEVWPPLGLEEKTYYLGSNNRLIEDKPTVLSSTDTYIVDFTASHGSKTRWHTNFDGSDVIYNNLIEEDKKLLTYTSAPLPRTIEITGTVELSFFVTSSEKDNLFIVYLEDVAPDGHVTYLTEGILRADNRKIVEKSTLPYETTGAAHSYLRRDALPMVPDEITEISFNLFPISAQIKARHQLRVAVAGADKVMFKRWPKVGTPEWVFHTGGITASSITVPYKTLSD